MPLVNAWGFGYKNGKLPSQTEIDSLLTNISYNNCGNRTNGEDHFKTKFAVNAGKRLGIGFLIDYISGRRLPPAPQPSQTTHRRGDQTGQGHDAAAGTLTPVWRYSG